MSTSTLLGFWTSGILYHTNLTRRSSKLLQPMLGVAFHPPHLSGDRRRNEGGAPLA
ncbi:MAG TPA: hypothetical protein VGX03_26220 [Candidatus Binatia bacterium]|nr:hypothetical protein [Candidatus Binatia bacterium]